MKLATILSVVLVICTSEVLGNACPRTNKRPGSQCVDECQPSFGCSDSKKECLCDGDCGYSCVKKGMQCSPLKKLRNGRITGSERTFNSTMTFQCNPTHKLFGASIRRCRAKGLWDGKKARCKISCSEPGIPKNVGRDRKISKVGFSERTILTYHCSPGYKTTDALTIKCQNDGQWSSTPPVCKVQQCGKVKLPANSNVLRPKKWRNTLSHQFGTRIYLACNPGYQSRVTIGVMVCQSNSWITYRPRFACYGKSCGDPGTPRNGKKLGLSYILNDVVRYSCDDCYKLSGVSYRQCLADGTWSGSLPTCTLVTCPPPSQLAHGTLSLSSQPIYCRSYVDYKCSIGYNLRGANRRTCLGDGSWSHSNPTCEIVDCGDPGHPNNGLTTQNNGFTYGNDVTFSCNANYVLEGSLLATCQSNGKWSKSLPVCLEKCSDPSGNTNARVIGKEFYHGREVEFVCSRDFILVPSASKKLTCQDGEWRGTIPSCKASCPSLPQLSDGYKNGRSRTHGSSVQFRCAYGHKLVGSSRVVCNDGSWSHKMPKCLAICRTIQRIDDGWVYGRGNLEGDVLSFTCASNYILDGEPAIKCTGNRRWNATKPTCRAPCRKLIAPANGRITQQGFRHNEKRQFECRPDYYLQGRRILTCFDGKWNYNPPTCLAPCRQFGSEPFRGGYKKRDGYRHNEQVVFGCRDPFVIDGRDTLRCKDGSWSNKLPSCGGPCKNLSAPKNGMIIRNGYKHKETITFGCRKGFEMIGAPDRICNFGVWSNAKIPRCEAKCSNPTKDTNARVVGNAFYHGKEVEFVCSNDEVLDPEFSKKLRCDNGRWNGIIPWCKAPCPRLPRISNGNIINGGARRTHGSFVQFSCNAGYQQVGSSLAVCNDGSWSQDVPKCLAKCSNPTKDTNARVVGNQFYHGQKVEFVCSNDEVLDPKNSKKLTCDYGRWNGRIPRCKAKCSNPTKDTNATVIGNKFYHGKEVEFVCLDDEVLDPENSKKLTCEKGTWNGIIPNCKVRVPSTTTIATTSTTTIATTTQAQTSSRTIISTTPVTTKTTTKAQSKNCPDIKNIRKGNVKGSGVSPGSKRTFSCINKNWVINGRQEITCLKSGQWSNPQPTCMPAGKPISCKVVGKIQNGFAIKNETVHGGRVVFQCNSNYIMVGRPAMLCRSGKWSRLPPKCNAPTPSTSIISITPATTKTATKARTPSTTIISTTPATTKTSIKAPCKNLSSPQNGKILSQSGINHKDLIVFGCNQGYTLKGSYFLQCKNGVWDATTPTCQKKN